MAEISTTGGQSQSFNADGMSVKDILGAITKALLGPVGARMPFGKDKTDEQKRAIEELKEIKDFGEGMDELNVQIKQIFKIIDKQKQRTEAANKPQNFGNLTAALEKMAGSSGSGNNEKPRKLNSLEAAAFGELRDMAAKANHPGSIYTHDIRMVEGIGKVIAELASLSAVIQSSAAAAAAAAAGSSPLAVGGIPVAGGGGGPPMAVGGIPVFGSPMPTAGGLTAPAAPSGSPLDGIDKLGEDAEDVERAFRRILDNAPAFDTALKADAGTLEKIIGLLVKGKKVNSTSAKALERMLFNWRRVNIEQRQGLINLVDQLNEVENKLANPKNTISDKHYLETQRNDLLTRLANEGAVAGEKFTGGFLQEFNQLMAGPGLLTRMGFGQHIVALQNVVGTLQNAMQGANNLTKSFASQYTAQLGLGPTVSTDVAPQLMTWNEANTRGLNQGMVYMSNMHKLMFQMSDEIGTATSKTQDWRGELLKAYSDQTNFYKEFGQDQDVVRKQAIKNARRGIGDSAKNLTLTKTSLSLAHLIGSEASSTGDELATWSQHFNMSNAASQQLAANIQRIGRQTGVTGDNLLNAVQSTKTLVTNMRDLGVNNEDTNKTLIQYGVTARKLGTENLTAPVMDALQSRMHLLNASPGTRTLLTQAASNAPGNVGNSLFKGNILNDRGAMKGLVTGMEDTLKYHVERITGKKGMSIKDLNEDQRDALNTFFQNAYGTGIGGVQGIITTLKETSMNNEEKLKEVTDKLTAIREGGNASSGEIAALVQREQQLKSAQAADQQTERMNTLVALGARLEPGVSMEKALAQAGMTPDKLRTTLTDAMKSANVTGDVAGAMSSGATLKNLTETIAEGVRLQQMTKQQDKLDPATQLQTRAIEDNNKNAAKNEEYWRTFLEKNGNEAMWRAMMLDKATRTVEEVINVVKNISSMLAVVTLMQGILTAMNLRQMLASPVPGTGSFGTGWGAAAKIGIGTAGLAYMASDMAEGGMYQGAFGKGGDTKGSDLYRSTAGMAKGGAIGAFFGPPGVALGAAIGGLGATFASLGEQIGNYMTVWNQGIEVQKRMNAALDKNLNQNVKTKIDTAGALGDVASIENQLERFRKQKEESAESHKREQAPNWWKTDLKDHAGYKFASVKVDALEANLEKAREAQAKSRSTMTASELWMMKKADSHTGYYTNKAWGQDDYYQKLITNESLRERTADETDNTAFAARRVYGINKDKFKQYGVDPQKLFDNPIYEKIENALQLNDKVLANKLVADNVATLDPKVVKLLTDRYDKESDYYKKATTPGSIYTHDMHLEEHMIALVETAEDANESMLQHRLATEFAGIEAGEGMTEANDHLEEICDYGRQQVELHKQELEALRAIVAAISMPAANQQPNTSSKITPQSPPNYFQWVIRQLNSPNYGGTNFMP